MKSVEGFDYALFPRIIGEVITKHHIQEFHLSLTQGTAFNFIVQNRITKRLGDNCQHILSN